MHTIIIPRAGRAPARPLWSVPGRALSSAFGWLVAWQTRASERARLLELSDHVLRDVGLTREQIEYAAKTTPICTIC